MTLISKFYASIIALLFTAAVTASCATSALKTPETARADETTAERIYSALNADPVHYYRHVDVRVDDGVAYLSGYIWSPEALYKAKEIAAATPGVRLVVSEMELERGGRRGGGHSGTG